MKMHKFFLVAAAFALVGQGCLPFGGDQASGNDGGVWQSGDSGSEWTQLAALPQVSGVGSIGGVNVNAIEIDPADDTTYYIGTLSNGMLYTHDNASTWHRPEDQLARSGNVLDIEVDPRDVCTLYVLKPDRILKTTTCMRTFETTYTESRESEELTALTIDWFNPDVLWLGTSNGEVLTSADAGASWTQLAEYSRDITAIEVSNIDSRIVLVGTDGKYLFVRDPETGEFLDLSADLREYSRTNDVFDIAQTANGSKIVMSTRYGLLVSIDKGSTWEPLTLVTPPGDVTIYSVAIDPKDEDTIYYTTENTFYVSRNGGESWEAFELPSTRAATALEVHPTSTNAIIAGFSTIE